MKFMEQTAEVEYLLSKRQLVARSDKRLYIADI